MGRRVLRKIKENVIFSFVVKVIVLGFTIHGDVALWAAIVSDVGAMLLVTLNGMTLLPSSKIDREKMGDIENVTYRSQVSGATATNDDKIDVENPGPPLSFIRSSEKVVSFKDEKEGQIHDLTT